MILTIVTSNILMDFVDKSLWGKLIREIVIDARKTLWLFDRHVIEIIDLFPEIADLPLVILSECNCILIDYQWFLIFYMQLFTAVIDGNL